MLKRIRNYPFLLWLGAALLMVVVFMGFTDKFLDGHDPGAFDLFILHGIGDLRSPLLTIVFVNLTALGSSPLLIVHTAIAFALLLSARDRIGAWQIVAASLGAFALTEFTKEWIERARPSAVPALVDAFGFSYPSGHALNAAAMYVTIAALGFRHLPLLRQRLLLAVSAFILVSLVGVSRVYLGVHYPSDALSGILLGTAWALLLAGVVSMIEYRHQQKQSGR